MIKSYWNTSTYSYGVRKGKTTFVGCYDPFALKVGIEGIDSWEFKLPVPSKTTTLNAANLSNWQVLIDNGIPNERFFIEAGTYHTGNLRWNGKPIQIIGELNGNGSNAVTIDGSVSINPASFVNNAGVWEFLAPTRINPLPSNDVEGMSGFYPGQNFSLWKNGIPYNSVPNVNLSANIHNCSLVSDTIRLNAQPTGTLRWGIFSSFIGGLSNAGGLVEPFATNGVILGNLDCINFNGNRNGAVIGRRSPALIDTIVPQRYHCYFNITVRNCRGDAVLAPFTSTLRNIQSIDNGRGSISGSNVTSTFFDAGMQVLQAEWSTFIGCVQRRNNWAGNDGGDSTKMVRQSSILIKYWESSLNGVATLTPINNGNTMGDGFWSDYGYYTIVTNCRFFRNYRYGIFNEVSWKCEYYDNEVFDNAKVVNDVEIYESTSRETTYQRNKITVKNAGYLRLADAERGKPNGQPFVPTVLGYADMTDLNFTDNDIMFVDETSRRLTLGYDKPDAPVISWKGLSSRILTIGNNRFNKEPSTYTWNGSGYDSVFGLAAIQALTKIDGVTSFNFEQGSVILN